MMTPIAYDESYFHLVNNQHHPAGYTEYGRKRLRFAGNDDDRGELFKTQHYRFYRQYRQLLDGKKVLEIGCAYGFFVEDMRELGVDVTGIDLSPWAISQAAGQAMGRCRVGNIISELAQIKPREYDVIVGLRVLPCFDDQVLTPLGRVINRIAPVVFMSVDDIAAYQDLTIVNQYYNMKTLAEWQALFPGWIIESTTDPKWVAR